MHHHIFGGRTFWTIGLVIAVATTGACASVKASPHDPSATTAKATARLSGTGMYRFSDWEGPALRVFYYVPEVVTPTTGVLIIMHGVNRDADRYRDEWQAIAQAQGLILVAPEFTKADFPGSTGYNAGNFTDAKGRARPRGQWSFAAIEPLFDDIRRRTGSKAASYGIYGHSAGAQFVHRFVTFMPDARYHRAIAANAGWYTMPDMTQSFPYGLAGAPIDEAQERRALGRPLTILLGTADTDTAHPNLRRTPEAMAQGPHRLARGHAYFTQGQAEAKRLGTPLGWTVREVPDVAHKNGLMAKAAAELLGR